jgi:hypothetical protein
MTVVSFRSAGEGGGGDEQDRCGDQAGNREVLAADQQGADELPGRERGRYGGDESGGAGGEFARGPHRGQGDDYEGAADGHRDHDRRQAGPQHRRQQTPTNTAAAPTQHEDRAVRGVYVQRLRKSSSPTPRNPVHIPGQG